MRPARSRSSRSGRRNRRATSTETITTTDRTTCAHQCISPSTIGPRVSAGKIISPAVSAITPTRSTTNVGPSVRNVPADAGTIFFRGQCAAERECSEHRNEAAEEQRDRAQLGREVREPEAGKRAAVVVRLRVVGVERLGEAVDTAVVDRRKPGLREDRDRGQCRAPSSARTEHRPRRS